MWRGKNEVRQTTSEVTVLPRVWWLSESEERKCASLCVCVCVLGYEVTVEYLGVHR